MVALTDTATDYLAFLEQGGFDLIAGIEWSDLRFPAARHAGRTLAKAGFINIVHESWNEDTPLDAGANLEAFQIAAAFPRLDKCYGQLDKIQTKAGRKLPIIIHPNGQQLGEVAPKRPRQTLPKDMFAEIWYQPTVEWAAAQGIETDSEGTAAIAEQIVGAQRRTGLDRTAVDLHHLTAERNGRRFRNPAALAVALVQAPSFGEVQVAIRPDFGGSHAALIAAYSGRLAETQTGEILGAIAAAVEPTMPIRVVNEIAATEIIAAGHPQITEAHAAINNGIRNILG